MSLRKQLLILAAASLVIALWFVLTVPVRVLR